MEKEVGHLVTRIRQQGYSVQKVGDGHYGVLDPQGDVVRLPSGQPFKFSGSPSDGHSTKNAESTLRSLGVLPAKNGNNKKLKREVLASKSDELREEVNELLRGGLKQSDIYHFADKWAAQHGIGVPVQGAGVVSKLLKGHSLSNVSYQWLSSAMSAIRRNGGIIPSMEHPRREQPQPEPEETGIEVVGEPAPRQVKLPSLALDAMQMIYKEEKDHDAILALVEEIAKLELK